MSMPLRKSEYYTIEDYYALPDDVRAELIDGELVNMAPPGWRHQSISFALSKEIDNMIKERGGKCQVIPAPFGVQLRKDEPTIVEPDITVICDPDKLSERGCTGAPDWIIEIASPSNYSHDYYTKLVLYKDAGVREYWIVDPKERRVIVYSMDEDFHLGVYAFDDTIPAGIYDDFSIDFAEVISSLPEQLR